MGIFSWLRSHRPSEIVEDQDDEPSTLIRNQPYDPELEEIRRAAAADLACRRLARENGGTIYFDDLSDGPTRFVLILPRALPVHGSSSNGNGVSTNGHAETPLVSSL